MNEHTSDNQTKLTCRLRRHHKCDQTG